ncbi:MAG: hypothetical protein K1Y36_11650 [Blastocatellia bacterium]|nr:hypothetical protein [Blastocatellia bacterium]
MFNRMFKYGLILGAIGFSLGFFGPMILNPTSGNGPLLGIFITGPGGFVLGLLVGLVLELRSPAH